MHFIFAAFADFIPICESSITTHVLGSTSSDFATFRYMSGAGFEYFTSSHVTIDLIN